jgi:hypothetical protein
MTLFHHNSSRSRRLTELALNRLAKNFAGPNHKFRRLWLQAALVSP